ncbi:MAG TPA: SIS domain-containing protein [Acidobacteriaceae bacterium]|nr:SIS domain-containing protein [Acidobacteriaceae bacterium]
MNPLNRLLALSETEKKESGLLHTPAEIAQQPATWRVTHRLFQDFQSTLQGFLRPAYSEKWTVYLIGAGTSDYIGHAVANLLRRRWQCEVSVIASTDLLTNREDLVIPGRKYLWISFSRSGESPEGIAVLEQALAQNPNVKHLVVSCNKKGRMVELAQHSKQCLAMLLDDRVNDRGLAMTSSFTNMVLLGYELAHMWHSAPFEHHLERMIVAAEDVLDQGSVLAYDLAQQGYKRACFVGSGALAATARESALKLLELTSGNIQTMNESTLGLRHGPMSSLNSETLFTGFISTDGNRRRYDVDLMNEIRAKQVVRTIVAIGQCDAASDYSLYSRAFDKLEDDYRPAVDVIFSQMLGLFASIELGLKPDSPSPNGVISRVVEQFAIYA